MPERIAKTSRRVGSPKPSNTPAKKRSRPPKTESAPVPIPEPTDNLQDITTSTSNTALAPIPQNQPQKPLEAYTGLTQISHGLTIPTFDANLYFAGDLFSNSSTLQETEKSVADETVESIEKKRQTLRIVGANIALNTDVVKTANDYRKFEGTVIDYATTGINNEIKFVNYQLLASTKILPLTDLTNQKSG